MALVNYACVHKSKSRYPDNYTLDMDMLDNPRKSNVTCRRCIFVGKNKKISETDLCAKYIDEVTNVNFAGTCSAGRDSSAWYNQINPIKKWLLERTGFVFRNR